MKRYFRIVILLCLLACITGSASALSDAYCTNVYSDPTVGPNIVTSPILDNGRIYYITAGEIFKPDLPNGVQADAQFYTMDYGVTWLKPISEDGTIHSFLQINDKDVKWGDTVNLPEHEYTVPFKGLGSPITLRLVDWYDTDYTNNWCHLPVCIIPQSEPPVANAGQDQTVIVNDVVAFDGSGSNDPDGTIESYAWDFGDIHTGSGVSTSHAYTAAGTYTVTLTVTDNEGLTGSDTAVITVKIPVTNVPVNVKIFPTTINKGINGYFLAFVILPDAYKGATIDLKTVSCSGAPAVRMVRPKLLPRVVGFVFKTSELNNVEVGKRVTLTVEGVLKNKDTTYTFTGSDDVKVINKPSWQPDDIKDVSKVSDDQLFKKFTP